MDMLSQEYPVKDICKMMGVSRSGYYKWLRREPSSREINREFMVGVVEDIHSEMLPISWYSVTNETQDTLQAT